MINFLKTRRLGILLEHDSILLDNHVETALMM